MAFWLRTTANTHGIALDETDYAVLVGITSGKAKGNTGWVANAYLEVSPENARVMADTRQRAEDARLKEQRLLSSLSRVTGGSNSVLVARSNDCARDMASMDCESYS